VKEFHYSRAVRQELTAKQKRNKKIKWLRKLYKDAKNAEIIQEQGENINSAALESAAF